ncbi:MAG: hypothetical protein M1828_006992 [Chrysothrix sp. TS-e1954]|nr:MAG: hypothetical protein M1828_006992 [Chrysothrix sp. TS-e1954]
MASSKPSAEQTSRRGGSKSPSRQKIEKPKDYRSEGVKNNDIFELPGSDWQILAVLTVLAAIVRLFRIYQPPSVVFDEVHFGGFATKYIKGKFFMDVHPPMAKMLIAAFGWMAGFKGDFDFKDIGNDYVEPGVPYVSMRLFPAICGVLTIPTMFLTLKAFGSRTMSAALGAGLVIFENGLLTNNRLILLDSPLVTTTAFTALAFVCFTNQQEQGPAKAFGPSWWFWLVSTGLGLGATVSIKWVGLFTIAWVGSLTLVQLWVLLGDAKSVSPRIWFKHLFARAFCLIVIPATFYLAMFAIHFLCLVNPGDGDGFMSSEFQATLNSKSMQDVPVNVAYGSRVSLRHHNTQGGYLHSHAHMYPEGSKQQQITLYPHKDENNVWLLENQTQPEGLDGPISGPKAWDTNATWLEDGAIIKLYHIISDRRLHSHDQRPPVTEADWQQEVSAYGFEGFEGDANDLFKVEIVKSMSDGETAKTHVRTIQTKFKLLHIMTGCVLFSHKVKLPEWGFEQQEVTCAKGGSLPNSVWYIEQNEHPALGPDAEKVNYRNPGFLGKFWELQRVMWTTNAGLVESHAWDSRPPSWPILKRGINFWGKDNRQIYLMGNPVIWLASTGAVALYLIVKGLAVLRWQRGYDDYNIQTFKRFDYEVGTTILGWAFHYFPFFLMQRQLFLHHYFPALYFAIMGLSQVYDFVHYRFAALGLSRRPAIGQATAIAFLAISIAVFTMYAPLAYGNPWTKSECSRVKLLDTWDWDCNNFHDDYAQYALQPASATGDVAPTLDTGVPAAPEAVITPKGSEAVAIDGDGNAHLQEGAVREVGLEYRDEEGNLMSPEEVEKIKDQVSFSTKYETRTRIVDDAGNEIPRASMPDGQIKEGQAPPHPDIEGRNPNTAGSEKRQGEAEAEASDAPPTVDAEGGLGKESAGADSPKKARPGSERDEATAKAA